MVGGHRYRVPSQYLVERDAPWLPRAEKQSFLFRLAPPDNEVTALVQSAKTDCPRLNECRLTKFQNISGQILKRQSRDDKNRWDYVTKNELIIARCFTSEGMMDGICSTVMLKGDVTISLDFPDRRASEVGKFANVAKAKLAEWEVRP